MKSAIILTVVTVTIGLSACSGARNVQTVKSTDYAGQPHNIAALIESAPSLDPRFKDSLVDSVKRCGAQLSFVTPTKNQPVKTDGVDSILTMQELAHETSTPTKYGIPSGPSHISMVRMVFTLTDVKSQKPIWKGQADLFTAQSVRVANPTVAWGDSVASLMQKDGLLGSCDFNRPSPPSTLPSTVY